MLFIKVKIYFRRIIARRFSGIIWFCYSIRFKFTDFNKFSPVIILTPGKVGSSSVYYTLKKSIPNPVYHIHNLSPLGIKNSERRHLESDRKSIPLHLIVSELLRKKLSAFNDRVYIITVVREPVSREISGFFQNTEFYKNSIESKSLSIDVKKAIEIIKKKVFSYNICSGLEDWFNNEIKENFGIDVFKHPFDTKKNYLIFKNGNNYLLLMKMETMSQIFSEAIQEFLSIKYPIKLLNSNIGENKHYALSYKIARENIKIESQLLEKIMSSKYFRYFYSQIEEKIRKRWSKKPGEQI